MRVLRYLKGTRDLGIYYNATSEKTGLTAYIDADWGGDTTDRKSTTGYAIMLNGIVVSSTSVKQKTVTTSTLEAEYIALAEVVKEALWFLRLLNEFGFKQKQLIVNINNQGAIDYARNAQFSQRTKHIDIKYYFIRDYIENGTIILQYIESKANVADILTKPLDKPQFVKLRELLGMRSLSEIKGSG